MQPDTGVVLMNMGGPDGEDDVRPYLENIFRDPHILDMPLGFLIRPFLAPRIARKRAPESIRRYNLIGGKTPLNPIADRQAELLQHELRNQGIAAVAGSAMRYWHPFVAEVLGQWQEYDLERVVLLSMYPHYCRATTFSCIEDFRSQKRDVMPVPRQLVIDRWFELPEYIDFLAAEINQYLQGLDAGQQQKTAVLFSAHSIPYKLYRQGDPYKAEVEHSYNLIKEKITIAVRTELGWQSAFGPARWLEPDSSEVVSTLSQEGIDSILVVPLGFVAENIETEWDIDIDLREHAEGEGIISFSRVACPNESPAVLRGLARLVSEAIRE